MLGVGILAVILTVSWNPVSVDIYGDPEMIWGYMIQHTWATNTEFINVPADQTSVQVDVGTVSLAGPRHYFRVLATDIAGNNSDWTPYVGWPNIQKYKLEKPKKPPKDGGITITPR